MREWLLSHYNAPHTTDTEERRRGEEEEEVVRTRWKEKYEKLKDNKDEESCEEGKNRTVGTM